MDIHREWGGVVPEIASRQHVRDICGVVERALADAGVDWPDIDAMAVTQGPGLVGSLLVGVSFAKAAAAALGKPIVAVHHLAGHIESIFLEHGAIPLPAAVLVVSGGHTSLYFVPEPGVYRLSAGRATMRPARRTTRSRGCSGSAIPGGPAIDRLAREGDDRGRRSADGRGSRTPIGTRRRPISMRRTAAAVAHLAEFSFSGLKTAVVRQLQQRGVPVATGRPCRPTPVR